MKGWVESASVRGGSALLSAHAPANKLSRAGGMHMLRRDKSKNERRAGVVAAALKGQQGSERMRGIRHGGDRDGPHAGMFTNRR